MVSLDMRHLEGCKEKNRSSHPPRDPPLRSWCQQVQRKQRRWLGSRREGVSPKKKKKPESLHNDSLSFQNERRTILSRRSDHERQRNKSNLSRRSSWRSVANLLCWLLWCVPSI